MKEDDRGSMRCRQLLCCLSFLLIAWFVVQPPSQALAAEQNESLSLTTGFDGTAGGGGIYFNITANEKPVLVTHFDINFRIDGMAEVYSKSGSHIGFEQTPAAWQSRGKMSVSGTSGTPTLLDIQDVIIPANETVGFYLFSFDRAGLGYSFGVALGETFTNDDISLFSLTSHSEDVAFAGDLFSPRTWNGTVYYELYEPETCYPIKVKSGAVSVVCL